jgi:hypothetical protein
MGRPHSESSGEVRRRRRLARGTTWYWLLVGQIDVAADNRSITRSRRSAPRNSPAGESATGATAIGHSARRACDGVERGRAARRRRELSPWEHLPPGAELSSVPAPNRRQQFMAAIRLATRRTPQRFSSSGTRRGSSPRARHGQRSGGPPRSRRQPPSRSETLLLVGGQARVDGALAGWVGRRTSHAFPVRAAVTG